MGVHMIKDKDGKEHFVLNDNDFHNDDIIGDKLEDYEILQILGNKPNNPNNSGGTNNKIVVKVLSNINSKEYAMTKIDLNQFGNSFNLLQFNQEFNNLNKMKHNNIIKYFKFFQENKNLYILSEFVNNKNLENYLYLYENSPNPIDENILWNIFMQCISSLKYIHSINIIHGNINLKSILMTENKIIKLSNFRMASLMTNNKKLTNDKAPYMAPEIKNNNINDPKSDIYSMGVVFHKLCFFNFPNSGIKKNEKFYSKEMGNIINLMIMDINSRPNTDELYNLIETEYINHIAKISSIKSIFICMFSYINFNEYMNQNLNNFLNQLQTPVSYNYLNFVNIIFSGENELDLPKYLYSFKQLLCDYYQIENNEEIKPSLVLSFFLQQISKETGNNYLVPSLGIQSNIIFNINKDIAYSLFYNNTFKFLNSFISQNFLSIIKTKRKCITCNNGFYSFSITPFIEFSLEKCGQNLDLEKWFFLQTNYEVLLNKKYNYVCENCNDVREFYEFKQFHSFPKYLIISINRGDGYKIKSGITFPMVLNLQGYPGKNDSFTIFRLVGIVKRDIDAKNEEFYISLYLNPYKDIWMISGKYGIMEIQDPLNHNEGIVMALFYSA